MNEAGTTVDSIPSRRLRTSTPFPPVYTPLRPAAIMEFRDSQIGVSLGTALEPELEGRLLDRC